MALRFLFQKTLQFHSGTPSKETMMSSWQHLEQGIHFVWKPGSACMAMI